ncbi:MAG TPA: hypothetical protein VFT69_07945 [Pseudolabrys sp.]|nr:hypothetical protein [Pseudolabrys sp.]
MRRGTGCARALDDVAHPGGIGLDEFGEFRRRGADRVDHQLFHLRPIAGVLRHRPHVGIELIDGATQRHSVAKRAIVQLFDFFLGRLHNDLIIQSIP